MRNLMRRIVWQATPLLVALFTMVFLAESRPIQEAVATRTTPAFVVPGEDVLFELAKKRCEERELGGFFRTDKCEYKDADKRKEAIDWEKWRAEVDYSNAHIRPKMEFIEDASYTGSAVLAFLLALVLLYNLYRYAKDNGVLDKLSGLLKAFRSRKAEHEFMRYKRLFENGLLSEEEFERKKRELKPKVLHGQA
jgi:hypothetical protein